MHVSGGERTGCMSVEERELVACRWRRENWLHVCGGERTGGMSVEERELAACLWRRENWLHVSGGERTGCMSVEERELVACQWRRENWWHVSGGERTSYKHLVTAYNFPNCRQKHLGLRIGSIPVRKQKLCSATSRHIAPHHAT